MRRYGCFVLSMLLATIAAAQNPILTVNKVRDPGVFQVGAPITYTIDVQNSGGASSHISIADALPPGFVFVNASCSIVGNAGGNCPTGLLTPPTFGDFNLPHDGHAVLTIAGYFTSAGPKTNTATGGAKDNAGAVIDVGTANVGHVSEPISNTQLPVDLSITKCTVVGGTCGTLAPQALPATLRYRITVTNNDNQAVYLGGILTVKDVLSSNSTLPLDWSASNFTCAPAANCPVLPSPTSPQSLFNAQGNISFPYVASSTNNQGLFPPNGTFTIEFDVTYTANGTCKNGPVTVSDLAFLDFAGLTDKVGNNTTPAVSTTLITTLPDCPPSTPGVQVGKQQVSLTPPNAAWNASVKYQVTVANPTNGVVQTNIALSDTLYKQTGTPPFTATVTAGPTCTSGCTPPLTNVIAFTPTVTSDFTSATLWTATLPNLNPGQQAVIEYTVVYAPVCESDTGPDSIVNTFNGGGPSSAVTTNMTPEATPCKLAVDKSKDLAGPVVFGQPMKYTVHYKSNFPNTLTIGTIRDAVSITNSSQYGTFPIDAVVTCQATAGVITPLTGSLPFTRNTTGLVIGFRQLGWQGFPILNESLRFGPGSVLTCDVTVTAHQPADTNPFCQGKKSPMPQLLNAALMDITPSYNPNTSTQPALYASQAADLPLCRSVVVKKTANVHDVGPGSPITYTITVENLGDDPVSSFSLTDTIQPPLAASAVSGCAPSAACTNGPTLTGNQVSVGYGLLQPHQVVSFTITVTAPQAGGSYPNLAVGTFPSGGNFYFQGDEAHFLNEEENVQVVTPVLGKRYEPVKIGPNGTSTLTFIITNTPNDPAQSGMSFADTLPPGLTFDSVVSNTCGGSLGISTDGRTLTFTGGQLAAGKHNCSFSIRVKATGTCGIFPNTKANFGDVANLDVTSINQQLEVANCPPGLTITKKVLGAPSGYSGQFDFLVQCALPDGTFYTKPVTVAWPTPGFIVLTDVPPGSRCTVSEGTLGSAPSGYNWSGLPVYKPNNGVITTTEAGGAMTVENSIAPCNRSGQVTITKVVTNAPAGFTGTFKGLLQCWSGGQLLTFPATLTAPGGLTATVNNIPLGASCTFAETVVAPLPTGYQWDPPTYTPKFGMVTLESCCEQIKVENKAHPCCPKLRDSTENPR